MDFIDDDPLETREQFEAVRITEQERERLRSGQQDVRWAAALAFAPVRGRVAAPRLDPQPQAHFLDRSNQIALHVMRQSLERLKVEGVEAVAPDVGPARATRRECRQATCQG